MSALRLALFTPLPPARTGTADYAAALLQHLQLLAQVDVFSSAPRGFHPARYDAVLYQIANNPHHAAIYDLALQHPGIVVLHEANLHHMVMGGTWQQGRDQAYLQEVAYELYGPDAPPIDPVRTWLELPQPHPFRLLRRLLDQSAACIVHGHYMANEVRLRRYSRPLAVVPHGAEVRTVDRALYRSKLGLTEGDPLLGIFGYQRPDKKASDNLLVFHELLAHSPRAHLLVVGESHPEVPLSERARELGIADHVTVLGHVPLGDFDGYLAACDVLLNLRRPTFGETSGTFMRACGLGTVVIVSDTGACRELPPDICVKIPPTEEERGVLLGALRWLTRDWPAARQMGHQAQQWVQSTCRWDLVAQQYVAFARAVADGSAAGTRANGLSAQWPLALASERALVLEPGLDAATLGYRTVTAEPGPIETGAWPVRSGSIELLLAGGALDRCERDPLHWLFECHRVLKPDGLLFLHATRATEPQHICYERQLTGRPAASRGSRRYTLEELGRLLTAAGFVLVETVAVSGDQAQAIARKENLPRNRYPSWLYR